ncbi:hypothetical protein ACFW35_13385 [Fictibacillus sp. NPDC058756]|uniref:hypothetical protein n=1 Tax=Fictibacillus sp. NPDC058756 TaxID=3346625 RepID=UPI00369F343F
MTIAAYSRFNQFKNLIQSLPSLDEELLQDNQFLLEANGSRKLEIYYAPFEYINERAKVVIVGITPGLHQMKKSFSTVLDAKNQTPNDEEILRQVKNNSSFEGTMRKNLVQMLDELGLHEYLDLSTSMELFKEASHLVHTTSVITYPVFYNGKNFSGTTPNILKNDILKHYVTECFAVEMAALDNPLIIPLGVNVSNVLNYLAEKQLLNSSNILSGFPHPSGGNGHRHKQFAENKDVMKEMLRNYFQKEIISG